ncbi:MULTISPECIES: histidinol dehydrogenase [Duncaniella]|uniref:histidinol dehydrogenase n=3 Tax=Muribaculaceae TaxID=2005473 RepID=UPI000AFA3E7B|nr:MULTISPECIES: histidinol dehydrogenase [Duncaniella]MBJ2190775.1 histidinol dehydrogenase [Muribaculaceae bacterium]MCX4285059.1 histidinol dehydrogenase [Duncaniella dubosii]
MQTFINPLRSEWTALTERNIPDDPAVDAAVSAIIDEVRAKGDAALREMALKFDRCNVGALEVSEAEIAEGCARVSDEVKAAIGLAKENISKFHAAQMPEEVDVTTLPGVRCLQRPVAIDRVGLYIPGGQAPLFSTVLMLACPAKIAGCREVILCTPQSGDRPIAPEILYAASICGIDRIYRVGGAQAIAAMALGTETIGRVDKIFGPGNRYVTKAKQHLSSVMAIDMPAGPSEVLVMADSSADATFVAADLLSQAEHGRDSQAILVCDSEETARKVDAEVRRLMNRLSRAESVEGSLSHSRLVVFTDSDDMMDFVNAYAPEHLIISMRDAWTLASKVRAAGSVFIGNYSPESAGDYASGTNHTLPTAAWARSYSGVNIDSFMRKITYQELTRDGLGLLAPTIVAMAEAEGLDAHALAVKVRVDEEAK